MADPIGPGDWVEYIGPPVAADNCGPAMATGSVWRCTGLTPDERCEICGGSGPGLDIAGQEPFAVDGGAFCPLCQFKPIHRPGKSTLIQDLKRSIKDGQPRAPVRAKAQP